VHADLEVVGEAGNGAEALRLAAATQPTILMDADARADGVVATVLARRAAGLPGDPADHL
jgi:DNA-binding NarL/FixJ family response regulator